MKRSKQFFANVLLLLVKDNELWRCIRLIISVCLQTRIPFISITSKKIILALALFSTLFYNKSTDLRIFTREGKLIASMIAPSVEGFLSCGSTLESLLFEKLEREKNRSK